MIMINTPTPLVWGSHSLIGYNELKKNLTIIFAVLVLLLALFLSGITIPLDILDSRLESLATRILDRKVTIYGPVRLKTSLQPSLQFDGLTIGDPKGWRDGSKHLLSVKHAQVKISFPGLIHGDRPTLQGKLTTDVLQSSLFSVFQGIDNGKRGYRKKMTSKGQVLDSTTGYVVTSNVIV